MKTRLIADAERPQSASSRLPVCHPFQRVDREVNGHVVAGAGFSRTSRQVFRQTAARELKPHPEAGWKPAADGHIGSHPTS